MTLKNLTKNTIVSSEIKVADSFLDQLFGLLKRQNRALLFNTRFGIHTFGMYKKIDVLVLDSDLKVKKIKKDLLPNRLFFWNIKYNKLIELPEGTIAKSKTQIDDLLLII